MDSDRQRPLTSVWPILTGCAALAALLAWLLGGSDKPVRPRLPGADEAPSAAGAPSANPALLGKVVQGTGVASDLPGDWPQFRGPKRTGHVDAAVKLARSWPTGKPPELWSVEVGEGYAGPAIANGCVYLMDYDREGKQDVLRCLSLADGREIWRYSYPVSTKRNHGMTRTVPSISGTNVVAIGPKCHVVCCDAATGTLRWALDLVRDFGAAVPEWYAGQCPLIDGDRVILAPGGPDALLMAVSLLDGSVLWRTPNPNDWKMTHSSVMSLDFDGARHYVYCANKGVVGVAAADGGRVWETTDWKISIATVPSPCILDQGRIFLTGGYNAGSLLLQVKRDEGRWSAEPLFRLDATTFGATQHTPILHQGHLYGIRADGKLVCLSLDGQVVWESVGADTFGLGPLLMADGLIYAMNDSGLLRLVEATPSQYKRLAEAKVLDGRESWGPMALAGGRLIVRDFTRMACLDVGSR